MLHLEIENLTTDWKDILNQYEKINELDDAIKLEKETYEPNLTIFPPIKQVFRSFTYFNIEKLKVVIIGQDCYHGKGQANGLCFSVPKDIKIPPSLRNILKEMSSDLNIKRTNTDFSNLAKQGILFLNSALTVREKCAGSHLKLWIPFTDFILKYISENSNKIIFVLWGNFAKNKKKIIDKKKHYILEATHPSPLSANRGGFFGCKHFSKINKLLKNDKNQEIDWTL